MTDLRNRLLSWCEVDASAFRSNLEVFRSLLGSDRRLLLVVKSNAYGHGLDPITRLAAQERVDALGVHQLDEAAAVRAAGWRGDLLILGYVPHARLSDALDLEVQLTVYDRATLDRLDALGTARGVPARCHLKLETGTWRQGILEEDLDACLDRFRGARGLQLVGLSTHFANIEDTTDHSYARSQLERFQALTQRVASAGFTGLLRHAACTAAVLVMPEASFDLARIGIGAYGLWPSRETLASTRARVGASLVLRPVLTWKTKVAQVKWVPAGSFVGYGCAHRTSRRTLLAVIPIGYADGYDRGLSGLAHVLVRGGRAQVLGRICMNIFMADVTDLGPVEAEEEVVLLGRQGSEEIRASDLASFAQTIPYEIVSRISPSIPRVVVDERGGVIG